MAYVPPHKRMQQPTREHDDTDAKIFSEAFSVTRCINLDQRKDKWKQMQRQAARIRGLKIERFSALESKQGGGDDARVAMEWDTSSNARWDRKIPPGEIRHLSTGEVGCALSHISLWEELSLESSGLSSMLILEDDACFFSGRNPASQDAFRFLRAFRSAWDHLPEKWGIFYLGFSDRGERTPVYQNSEVEIFQPIYGFHTHAYAITKLAAATLLDNLPVKGPLDVWLADNTWFGIPVYCAVVANEGWKRQGAPMIYQNRRPGSTDVVQSGRNTTFSGAS